MFRHASKVLSLGWGDNEPILIVTAQDDGLYACSAGYILYKVRDTGYLGGPVVREGLDKKTFNVSTG